MRIKTVEMKKIAQCFIMICLFPLGSMAQNLIPGAVAFIGFQSDQPITFAFINLVPIEPNTSISFTDNKWGFDHLVLSEQTVVWTSPDTVLPVGTIVTLRDNGSSNMQVIGAGSTTGRLYIMGGQGDQILAYIGTESNPSFIAGISNSNWQTVCDSLPFFQFRTCLPDPLENGYTAVSFTNTQSFNVDNGYLSISPLIVSGTEFLSIINNPNYWFLDNAQQAYYENWPDWTQNTTLPTASTIEFSQSNFQISEGGSQALLTLSLSSPQFAPQTAIIEVLEFPGISSGDYSALPPLNNGTISIQIPANTLEFDISVQALLDGIGESTENITFSIASVSGGLSIGDNDFATVSIINTDQNFSQIQFVSDTVYITEGGAPVQINLNIDPPNSDINSVIISSFNGAGIATDYFTTPSDFNGQLLLQTSPNNPSVSFSVGTYNDFQIEADEVVQFSITTVSNSLQIGAQASVVLIIQDNDNTPTVYFPELFINEVCAVNVGYPDENNQFDDWIEIYNADTGNVVMSGYKLTNTLSNPALFSIPPVSSQTTIPSQGFKVFWADQNTFQGPLHLNFTLNQNAGGLVALFAPDAETLIDQLSYPPMGAGESFGRIPDGGSDLRKLYVTTPGAPNLDSIPPLFLLGAESKDGLLSAFPNPSKGMVNLVKTGKPIAGTAFIKVYDIRGCEIAANAELLQTGKSWRVNTQTWSAGIYTMVLNSSEGSSFLRIMVE
jgi:hypothetical protein